MIDVFLWIEPKQIRKTIKALRQSVGWETDSLYRDRTDGRSTVSGEMPGGQLWVVDSAPSVNP